MAQCPYCFSELGTWTNDPLLVVTGSRYSISDGDLIEKSLDQREYKGFSHIQYIDILELQQARQEQEILMGIPEEDRTEFSPVNTTGLFVCTKQHIQELRDSIEALIFNS